MLQLSRKDSRSFELLTVSSEAAWLSRDGFWMRYKPVCDLRLRLKELRSFSRAFRSNFRYLRCFEAVGTFVLIVSTVVWSFSIGILLEWTKGSFNCWTKCPWSFLLEKLLSWVPFWVSTHFRWTENQRLASSWLWTSSWLQGIIIISKITCNLEASAGSDFRISSKRN